MLIFTFIQGIHNYMPGKPHVSRVRTAAPVVTVVTVILHAEFPPFGYLKRQLAVCTDLSRGYYWRSVNTSFFFLGGGGVESKTNLDIRGELAPVLLNIRLA